MAEVKHTYYDSGELESECFTINGKMHGEKIESYNKKLN